VKQKPELLTHPIVQQSPLCTRDALYGGGTESMHLRAGSTLSFTEGATCLLHGFSDISSVSSSAGCAGFRRLHALVLEIIRHSLGECKDLFWV
jgi:hypothetical protein